MASTASKMMPLGQKMPDFSLNDVLSGKLIDSQQIAESRAVLVMFICNHCPYVVHIRSSLTALCNEFVAKGLAVVAINSNDIVNFPDDAPEKMQQLGIEMGFNFPYCFDESQEVAKAFDAACTPDFFLFDDQQKLAYRGQFDDSRPSNEIEVTGKDLRLALEAVMQHQIPSEQQRPSIGCNIKWKN